MYFNKVYIELTNICGLSCDFCPTKLEQKNTINLEFFENILKQLQPYTREIAYHIFGDPLTLSNLKQYLDLSLKYKFKVHITTTGYYLSNFNLDLFLHKAIKQINFSLNSFNKNDMSMTLDEYLKPILNLCKLKLDKQRHNFINLRLWNIDENNTESEFNNQIFNKLEDFFNIDLTNISYQNAIRLENQIKLHFDKYFQWPNLNSQHHSNNTCQGLKSHFGILSNGIVVPCCLDSFGIINLGNLNNKSLQYILNSKRTTDIINGFKEGNAVEILCQKCTYKDKFGAIN